MILLAFKNGIKIDDISFLILAIFYVGDCILVRNRRVIDMTIDEAIAKYKEITNTDANCPAHCNISCDKCVQESEQLTEWLEDYKRIKMLIPIEQALKAEYNKAIDDFVRFANTMPTVESEDGTIRPMWLEEIAERLKAGGK